MKEITIPEIPEKVMYTEYGHIIYKDWCERECSRLQKGTKTFCYFIKEKKGKISIWKDKK